MMNESGLRSTTGIILFYLTFMVLDYSRLIFLLIQCLHFYLLTCESGGTRGTRGTDPPGPPPSGESRIILTSDPVSRFQVMTRLTFDLL